MDGKLIEARLLALRGEVSRLCLQGGRDTSQVKVIAVTKKQSIETLLAAYRCGIRRFGENYVQEALTKQKALAEFTDIEWHFIGHLQRNKVRNVVGHFSLIHSVDSVRLAEVISRCAQDETLVQKVLLQINVGHEKSKGGFDPGELMTQLLPGLLTLPGITLCGIMSFPPPALTEAMARRYFSETRECWQQISYALSGTRHEEHFQELSMGTSSDYPWAVLEGATLLRLGTTLLGPRT